MVLMPRRWHQAPGNLPGRDGGKKARSPGRVRAYIVNTIACGNAGCFGVSVVTNARAIYTTRAAAGALAPGIPHALPLGESDLQTSGETRRENAKVCLTSLSVIAV
jgi:hypothetical protein